MPSEGRLSGSIVAVLIENSLMKRLFASQKQKDFITEMFLLRRLAVQVLSKFLFLFKV